MELEGCCDVSTYGIRSVAFDNLHVHSCGLVDKVHAVTDCTIGVVDAELSVGSSLPCTLPASIVEVSQKFQRNSQRSCPYSTDIF